MTSGRTTIEDVARAAGVSRGTVSRVLNNSPKVSPTAREAVERAIKQTHYRANPHARSLASGKANAIAVLLTRPNWQLFEDPTFNLMLQGISDGLAGTEMSLVLLIAGNADERRRAARFIDPHHVDGVIHLSPLIEDPMVDVIAGADVPVVVCGRPSLSRRTRKLWSVTATDIDGAREATAHLLSQGAARPVMIAGPEKAPGSVERIEGFEQAMGERFEPGLVVHGDYGRESGARAMAELLDEHPNLDAVFCASDRMALGALETLRVRGLHVPDDVMVVGFDDHHVSRTSIPPLSTVHQPIRQIGRAAVDMLLTALSDEDPGNRVFNTHLVIRDSSQPAAAHGGEATPRS